MLTESYGGVCQNCGYDRTLVRYGSDGYFQYDACPNCWFAFGEGYERDAKGNWELQHCRDWEVLEGELRVLKSILMEKGFPVSVLGIMLYLESLPDIDEIDQVFDYTKFDWEEKMKMTPKCPKCKIKLVHEKIEVTDASKAHTVDRWVWSCPNCKGFLGCDGKMFDWEEKNEQEK